MTQQARRQISIFDVASLFLSWESMTHKKLQKLCYYAQAWHLALLNKPLFSGVFEAWVHGPVEPRLYQKYKEHGWDKIPSVPFDESCFEATTLELLEAVYNTYGEFSGDELEALTHSELPWKEARKGLEEWQPSNNPIDEETMKSYYLGIYEQTQND